MAQPAAVLSSSKTCSKCGQDKPIESFRARKGSRDGRHGWCDPCYNGYYSQKSREWRTANRERDRANQRNQYWSDPEKARDRKRTWDEGHRDLVNARAREAHRRAWADPAKRARILERNRRRQLELEAASTPALVAAMVEMYELPCTYCGATEDIQIDHVVPLARGGKHELSNLTPACGFCNRSKKDRPLSEWFWRQV